MSYILIIICFLYGLCAVYFAKKNDYTMLCFFLVAVLFQNIIVICFSNTVSSIWITIFSLVKEVMLYLAVFIYIFRRKKITGGKKTIILSLVLVIIFVKNLIVTDTSFSASVISLRQCIIPFLGIAIGKNLYIDEKKVIKLLKFIVHCSIFLAIFGLFELIILGDEFWIKLGYAQYMYVKQGTLTSQLFKGVTRNFYTWDFSNIPIRRIVSITADPLATAHLIFIGFAIIFSGCVNSFVNKSFTKKNPNQYFVYMILLFMCSLLSLSKAIFAFMAITFAVIAYYKKIFPPKLVKYGTVIGGVLILLYILRGIQDITVATATSNHVVGLINGFQYSSILGKGLGTAGVMTAKIANNSITTSESYVGTYAQQIGYIGFAITLIYFINIYKQLLVNWKKYRNRYTILAMALFLGIIFEMFFSESSVSVMGTCIYFIFIGIATKDKIYK